MAPSKPLMDWEGTCVGRGVHYACPSHRTGYCCRCGKTMDSPITQATTGATDIDRLTALEARVTALERRKA